MPVLSFVQHELQRAPAFEAVSYTWGSPDCRYFLETEANSGKIAVTDNLALALPYLAVRSQTGYLWIDQMCINQADLNEKSVQISLMGTIFRESRQVLVWLDPVIDFGSSVDWHHSIMLEKQREATIDEHLPDKIFRVDKDVVDRYYGNLGTSTPWFTRAWCVQEFVLAEHVLFIERTRAMPLEEFDRLHSSKLLLPTSFQTLVSLRNLSRRSQPDHLFLLSVLDNYGLHFRTTQPQDRLFAFLGLWNPPGFVPEYRSSMSEVCRRFVLDVAINTGCLDFLACARVLSLGNYERTADVEGIWPTWVPRWRKFKSPSPDLLKDDENDLPEPFWTPWGRFQKSNVDSVSRWYRWRASSGRRFSIEMDRDGNAGHDHATFTPRICVKGKILDCITGSSRDLPLQGFRGRLAELDRLWEYCFTAHHKVSGRDGYTFLTHFGNIFQPKIEVDRHIGLEAVMFVIASRLKSSPDVWHTNARQDPQARIWHGSGQPPFTTSIALLTELEKYPQIDERSYPEFLRHGMRFCRGRSVFQTRQGRLGLAGPMDALDDEALFGTWPNGERKVVIAVIHGCSVPLLLLRQDPETSSESNVYQVLTECYVHGIMQGEAVDWEEDKADTLILVRCCNFHGLSRQAKGNQRKLGRKSDGKRNVFTSL